jgi:hypothetical protein
MTIKQTALLLAITALGFSACQQKQPANPVTDLESHTNLDTLGYKLALAYVKNYEKHAGTADSIVKLDQKPDTLKVPNTRAIWFSTKRLQNLLDSVNKYNGDGVRFYMGTYHNSYPGTFVDGHIPDKMYWGRNTLIMVSTTGVEKDGKTLHWDFYKGKPAPGQNSGAGGFIVGTPPENRGEQCPPPRVCSSIGATLVQ